MIVNQLRYVISQQEYLNMQTIRKYIKVTPQVERYQCNVCFQMDHKIVRLLCPCQKYICLACIRQRSYCTLCNISIQVEAVQPIKLVFYCMSNSDKCQLTFSSEKELLRHCIYECSFMEESLRKELKQAQLFQCQKGHRLIIANSYRKCSACQNGYMCKSQCTICVKESQSSSSSQQSPIIDRGRNGCYCVLCRPIPCTTKQCPHEHDLIRLMSRSATCDLCGISVRRYSPPYYNDQNCDFDICSICYLNLPEENSILPIPFSPIQ